MTWRYDKSSWEVCTKFFNLCCYLLRCSVWKQILCIYTTAEGDLSVKFGFQVCRIHSSCKGLNRMNNIYTSFNEKRNSFYDRTTGMIYNFNAIAVSQVDQLLSSRNYELFDQFRADHKTSLASNIITDQDCLYFTFGSFQEYLQSFYIEVYDMIIYIMNHFRFSNHVHKACLHTECSTCILEMAGPEHTHNYLVIRSFIYQFTT